MSKINQRGGDSGSGFQNFWRSSSISPAELSRITLQNIDCSPMFNPLRSGTVFPTGTSGITPTGVYLANVPAYNDSCITVECNNRAATTSTTAGQQTGGAHCKANKPKVVVRTPVYYNEITSKESCSRRCKMSPARPAPSKIGCKNPYGNIPHAGQYMYDYEAYYHINSLDKQARIDQDRAYKHC